MFKNMLLVLGGIAVGAYGTVRITGYGLASEFKRGSVVFEDDKVKITRGSRRDGTLRPFAWVEDKEPKKEES